MRIVITGGAGFLGSKLCEALLARGALAGPEAHAQQITEIISIEHFKAAATRYDKHPGNYLAMIKLASIRIRMRFNEPVILGSADNY